MTTPLTGTTADTHDARDTTRPGGGDSAPQHSAPVTLGVPPPSNLRDLATRAASAVVVHVVERQRERWRRNLEEVRSTLISLERASESVGAWSPEDAAADVSGLVDGLVAAAAADASAAAEKSRAEARAAIEQLQSRLARLETASQALQEELTRASARLQEEHELRVGAQTALANLQRRHEHVVAELRAELQTARRHVDAARCQSAAFRAQLTTSLETALRAVRGDDAASAPDLEDACRPPADDTPSGAGHAPVRVERVVDASGGPAPAPRALTLVAPAPPTPTAAPEDVEQVDLLLVEAESKYGADIRAGFSPLEVVDRLTGTLRQAREQFVAASGSRTDRAADLFKDRLASFFNERTDTTFGRHLGISIYELYPVAGVTGDTARKAG
jgi:hypothetical protein